MAILKCIECGHEVSEFAQMCPQCNCPVEVIKKHNNPKVRSHNKKQPTVNKKARENFESNITAFIVIPCILALALSILGYLWFDTYSKRNEITRNEKETLENSNKEEIRVAHLKAKLAKYKGMTRQSFLVAERFDSVGANGLYNGLYNGSSCVLIGAPGLFGKSREFYYEELGEKEYKIVTTHNVTGIQTDRPIYRPTYRIYSQSERDEEIVIIEKELNQ